MSAYVTMKGTREVVARGYVACFYGRGDVVPYTKDARQEKLGAFAHYPE